MSLAAGVQTNGHLLRTPAHHTVVGLAYAARVSFASSDMLESVAAGDEGGCFDPLKSRNRSSTLALAVVSPAKDLAVGAQGASM